MGDQHPAKITLVVQLLPDAVKVMDQMRGELTRDAFLSVVLRMMESGAVSSPPKMAKAAKPKKKARKRLS